ncbi:hypothetical protein [Streptomyces sp. NPDC001774]
MSPPQPAAKGDREYQRLQAAAWAGWTATGLIVVLRATGTLGVNWASLGLITIGAAITASLSLSRLRLASTVSRAFQAGLTSAVALQTNALTPTCLVCISDSGFVVSATQTDAIGWREDALVGEDLSRLLSPGEGGERIDKFIPGIAITAPLANEQGLMFDAKIAVASLGDRLVATIVPVGPVPGATSVRQRQN